MPSLRPALLVQALLCVLVAPVLAACGNSDSATGPSVSVEASDDRCKVGASTLEAGPVTAIASEHDDAATVRVDLASQTISLPDGEKVEFPVDPFSKTCLLEGVDELGWILKQEAAIAAYEAARVGSIDTRA